MCDATRVARGDGNLLFSGTIGESLFTLFANKIKTLNIERA